MKRIAFGFFGNRIDNRGVGNKRWHVWRPTLDLCRQQTYPVDVLELLYHQNDQEMVDVLLADIAVVAPHVMVNTTAIHVEDAWDFESVYTALLDVANGYAFDTENNEYVVNLTTGTHVVQICWFLLAEARFFPAKLMQLSPAKSGTRAVFNENVRMNIAALGETSLINLDLQQYEHILSRFTQQSQVATDFLKSGIATQNAAFNQMIGEIERVAIRSHAPILLTGPTGAGKSFLAKRIYQLKAQQNHVKGQFVAVNCATLRGDNAMAALFGHRKGAFTGAEKAREGLLKAANHGLLFLDEIGELGLDEQAMLLTAIEDKCFYPLGADKAISSDFQLIAGTNRDLKKAVTQGKFREDLFARINLWTYALPGLKDRLEDLPPNIEFELQRYAKEYGQKPRFKAAALKHFLSFSQSPEATWQGNFRDLNAAITRMATLANQAHIDVPEVDAEIVRLQRAWQPVGCKVQHPLLPEQLDEFDACQLNHVLHVCQSSKTLAEAGRRLFAQSRLQKESSNDSDRLKKYLAKFNLTWQQIV